MTHTQAHTYTRAQSSIPVWSRLRLPALEQIMWGKTVGFLKLSLSVTLCQPCISLYQTHTFAPPLLKQHREQGLWIINTPKFPHNSGQRCPSSKQCWCVEEESHGRSLDEYRIRVQTQHRTEQGLLGSKLGLQSKRASGLKLQNPCVHTDNWHPCRRWYKCNISKKSWEYIFLWNLKRNCRKGTFLTKETLHRVTKPPNFERV